MKRPLAGCCILFLFVIWVMQTAGDQSVDLPLFQTEQILREQVGEGNLVTVSGHVSSCSTLSSGVRLFIEELIVYSDDNSEFSLLPETKLTVTTEQTTLQPGDYVQMTGKCHFFSKCSNPGQFDERAYYFSKDTVCTLRQVQIEQDAAGAWSRTHGISRMLHQMRRAILQSFYRILDDKPAGTISAIVLGEKSVMDREWKTLFQEGGIAHILAVSGLHVTMAGSCLYRILRAVGMPIAGSAGISGLAVFLYALMTGFSLSAVRASVMFLIWLGAQVAGRKYDRITGLASAAVLIAGRDASSLWEASFLLSFTAVLTLAVLLPAAEEACQIHSSFGRSLLSCVLVWVGTLPVTAYFFYQSAPWSILVNLAVVPLMSVLMAAGICAAAAGLFCVPLGMFLAAPVHYLLNLFEFLCRLQRRMVLPVWVTGRPSWWRIALFYGILAALLIWTCRFCSKERGEQKGVSKAKQKERPSEMQRHRERRKWSVTGKSRLLWLACLFLCVLLMIPERSEDLQILCLDVGQGDSTLVRFPDGTNCLIDGGSSSVSQVWQYRIEDAVKYYGIDTLDYVFLSHADRDHISGLEELLEQYEPGFGGRNAAGITVNHLVLPPVGNEHSLNAAVGEDSEDAFAKLRSLAAENGIPVLIMQQGAEISSTHDWSVGCLAPQKEQLSGDRNEDSLVLLVQYKQFRMLFTGDLEGRAEQKLADCGADLRADILKAGHHGSKNSSSEAFLRKVQPKLTVISCGEDNSYGHPAPETLERLEQAGSRIMQTPQTGAVIIRSDGETFSAKMLRECTKK